MLDSLVRLHPNFPIHRRLAAVRRLGLCVYNLTRLERDEHVGRSRFTGFGAREVEYTRHFAPNRALGRGLAQRHLDESILAHAHDVRL